MLTTYSGKSEQIIAGNGCFGKWQQSTMSGSLFGLYRRRTTSEQQMLAGGCGPAGFLGLELLPSSREAMVARRR